MKKQLLLSLLVILCIGSSFAQIQMEEHHNHDRKMSEKYSPSNNNKSDGGWFNYGKEIETLSTDFSSSAAVIHPDSSMVDGYINTDATSPTFGDTVYYNVWHHSEGQMLDPTSFNFFNTGDADPFTLGEGFILDTIEFIYGYSRPQTTNPDKLIIQVYTTASNGGIVQSGFVGGADFYHAEYDTVQDRGKNAVQTIEYDLTDNDATPDTAWGVQSFALNPPIEMPSGGLVAVTYTFIPGNTFNPGDTLYSSDMPWVQNPRNSFLVSYFRDSEPVLDPGFENYNLSIPSDIQYNTNTNGWNGSYIPGNAWSNADGDVDYHQNIWFHLTSIPSSATNFNATSIKLYPNPAKDKMNIAFSNTNNVNSIRITDLTGRIVYTQTIANNTNPIEVTTNNYSPGIYFCEINGATTTERIKFSIIK
jgi:hypothetical protein